MQNSHDYRFLAAERVRELQREAVIRIPDDQLYIVILPMP